MLHPDTEVQWMDVKSQQVFTDTISKMFQMYSHKSKRVLDVSETLFNIDSEIIKITDMNGWTDVKSIRRIDHPIVWLKLKAAGNDILLSTRSEIPIYQPDDPFKGFHGETKYPFTAKQLTIVEDTDMVRVRRGIGEFNEGVEFTNIKTFGYYQNCQDSSHGYEVTTKSGFFNANNIHLLGSEKL